MLLSRWRLFRVPSTKIQALGDDDSKVDGFAVFDQVPIYSTFASQEAFQHDKLSLNFRFSENHSNSDVMVLHIVAV